MLLGINEDYTLTYQLIESNRRFNSEACASGAAEWLETLIQSFRITNIQNTQISYL